MDGEWRSVHLAIPSVQWELFFSRLLTFHLINLESFWKKSGGKTIQLSFWTVREHCSFSFKSNQVSSQSWLRSLFLLTCKVAAYHPKVTASSSWSQAQAKVCRWEMQQIHYWQGCSHHCGSQARCQAPPLPPSPIGFTQTPSSRWNVNPRFSCVCYGCPHPSERTMLSMLQRKGQYFNNNMFGQLRWHHSGVKHTPRLLEW